jgi:O-acetylserine/cysteine efflux transporter
MEAGLTSLLLQLQVFLSMFIGIFFFKERVRSWHVLGCAISFLGIGIVIGHISGSFKIIALFPIFGAAICSSIGNLLSKKFNHANSISLVSWGSLVAWPILLVATFCIQGFDSIVSQLQQITPSAVLGICYISYLSTLFAYGTWCWLLANYPLRTITPFTLLTPIFALLSASIFLGEQLFLWKILAAALVITGLAINLFGHHILKIPPPFD